MGDPIDVGIDMLKTLGEKAFRAGKKVAKEVKTAVGIPTGPITEANPRYYLVIARQGALVRESVDLDSKQVYGLRRGDIVTAVEMSGRRARIIDPVEGWVSLVTAENDVIMEMTFPPDKRTQVQAMERRFEKLKTEQLTAAYQSTLEQQTHGTPANETNCRSSSVGKSSSIKPLSEMKSKLAFKAPDMMDCDMAIPALAGPSGFKIPPPPSRKPDAPQLSGYGDDLLDLVVDSASPIETTPLPAATSAPEDPFAGLAEL